MSISENTLRRVILACSGTAFACSLFLPALLFEQHNTALGIDILLSGWLGIVTFDFAWYANPVYAFALWRFNAMHYAHTRFACIIALALGMLSFFAKEWWFNEGSGTPIVGLGIAFYFWMSSFSLLLIGSFMLNVSNLAHKRRS